MIQKLCRLWTLMIVAVLTLTIYNVLLTLKLLSMPECGHKKNVLPQTRPIPKPQIVAVHSQGVCSPQMRNLTVYNATALQMQLGRWDNQRKFKLFDHVIVGALYANASQRFQTCLATQSSLDRISGLVDLAANWDGPMSVATYAASYEELSNLLSIIALLRRCSPNVRSRATFHLAIPADRLPTSISIDTAVPSLLSQTKCSQLSASVHSIADHLFKLQSKSRLKLPYPQNLLRNLARKNCHSKYVFLTDVDIVPSRYMATQLNGFLQHHTCPKLCAYVIPTYELDERVRFPANKTELVRLANKGLARPFHHKVFIYNQYATNFSRWQNTTVESSDVHISHEVTNFEFFYEPFYVAIDTVPPHDERFVGYGYTRNTQVYEMFMAGYEFLVLSPIYTCHWGLQAKKNRQWWREEQNSKNRQLFDQFKKEIIAKYVRDAAVERLH